METIDGLGVVLAIGVFLLGLVWLIFPFYVMHKIGMVLIETKEHTKILRQLHAELIDANSWHARNDAFNDDRRKRSFT